MRANVVHLQPVHYRGFVFRVAAYRYLTRAQIELIVRRAFHALDLTALDPRYPVTLRWTDPVPQIAPIAVNA